MPPARMPTLSAELSLNARRTTCHQPRGGIWVGVSASSPCERRVRVDTVPSSVAGMVAEAVVGHVCGVLYRSADVVPGRITACRALNPCRAGNPVPDALRGVARQPKP